MTNIVLHTNDQHLIVTQKVKIAAGDIGSVKLKAHLDSSWDIFPYVFASVANDNLDNVPFDVNFDFHINDDDIRVGEGLIPVVPLSESGTLSIGITGVSEDGTKRKTSTIAKLKIQKSLAPAETTVSPEMDLYMQFISVLKEEINPTTLHISRMIDEKAAAIEEMIEEQRTWMNGDALWENPDPSAEIGDEGLTIPIDRTKYPRLHIEVLSGTIDSEDETKSFRQCLCVHSNGKYTAASVIGAGSRTITVTDTNIHVGKSSHSDYETIPFKIIGYKY